MKLFGESFRTISTGIQTIELRLYDEKRRLVRPDDQIVFTFKDKICRARVVGLTISDSFANLAKIVNIPDTGWRDADTLASGMRKYYTNAEQKKYGVVGIHLQPVK